VLARLRDCDCHTQPADPLISANKAVQHQLGGNWCNFRSAPGAIGLASKQLQRLESHKTIPEMQLDSSQSLGVLQTAIYST